MDPSNFSEVIEDTVTKSSSGPFGLQKMVLIFSPRISIFSLGRWAPVLGPQAPKFMSDNKVAFLPYLESI